MVDNGVLLFQRIITKKVAKEENQQVRNYYYCVLSKYEQTEEKEGCAGKKLCFLINRKSMSSSCTMARETIISF